MYIYRINDFWFILFHIVNHSELLIFCFVQVVIYIWFHIDLLGHETFVEFRKKCVPFTSNQWPAL